MGLSIFELIGLIISTFSVYCMLKKNILYWYSAILCNILWLTVFFSKSLYISAALQISYILFAVYGIYRWKYIKSKKKFPSYMDYIGMALSLVIISIALFNSSFQDAYSVIEIIAVIFLITANLFTAKEKAICWYFWIIGNILYAIFLLHAKVYGIFLIQFIFLALSIWGLYEWKKKPVYKTK
jgi:nicotinamide mononucleotide transporter